MSPVREYQNTKRENNRRSKMSETSTTKDIFKHTKGSFDRLNSYNYPTWKLNCRYLLLAVDSWEIVTGEEIAPIVPNDGNPLQIGVTTRLLKEFKQRRQDATFIILNCCGVSVQAHINRTDNPKEMWDTLARMLDTASHTVGRQSSDLWTQFHTRAGYGISGKQGKERIRQGLVLSRVVFLVGIRMLPVQGRRD
jgi:hypothetical protein